MKQEIAANIFLLTLFVGVRISVRHSNGNERQTMSFWSMELVPLAFAHLLKHTWHILMWRILNVALSLFSLLRNHCTISLSLTFFGARRRNFSSNFFLSILLAWKTACCCSIGVRIDIQMCDHIDVHIRELLPQLKIGAKNNDTAAIIHRWRW